jgi:hypothetical protein
VYVPSVQRFTPGPYDDAPGHGKIMIVVKVRIVNGTKTAVDASMTTVNVRSGDAGDEADETYADGVNSFSGNIAPGRKATARYVFIVPKASARQLDIEVEPGFLDYEAALFTGGM